ncbi:MAG TPA: mechanosensitive ion channel domain-containing protein [Gammaproteobacteria bacterium]|jgi:small-conductance mechanosensitive channel|nr:mechanosensitive ion channel domain-containing protein [Gammaproteobacteria bacterium]
MTLPKKLGTHLAQRTAFRAARFPLIYLLIGVALIALGYVDNIFPFITWKHFFDLTDLSGRILSAIAILLFFYNLVVLTSRRIELRLHEKHQITELILGGVRKGISILFILLAINVIISIVSPTQTYLNYLNNAITVVIIAALGWIAIHVLYTFEAVLYQVMISQKENNSRAKALYTKLHIIRNIATVLIVIITAAAILMTFSSVRNIGISLLASAGFLTAIIGLAAQKTLFSLFSGIQIAVAQPIKIGDIVLLDKESGVIEEITFTYVTIKLGDQRRLVVPISTFIEKPFENWSHEGDSIRSSFLINVDYLMPIAPLREELKRIVEASPLWDRRAQKMQVANISETSVELRIQVSAINADNLSDLRAEVREKLLTYIQTHHPQHFPKYGTSTQ